MMSEFACCSLRCGKNDWILSPAGERCSSCGHWRCANCQNINIEDLPVESSSWRHVVSEDRRKDESRSMLEAKEGISHCIAFNRIAYCMKDILELPACSVVIRMNCTIESFVLNQLDGNWKLSDLLVLSGTDEAAYATTIQEYIKFAWGDWGLDVLLILEAFYQNKRMKKVETQISQGPICEISSDSDQNFDRRDQLQVSIQGTGGDACLITTLFAWMVSVFTEVPENASKATKSGPCLNLRLSSTYLWKSREDAGSGTFLGPGKFVSESKKVEYYSLWQEPLENLRLDLLPENSLEGTCWMSLFQNSAMAYGFPVPSRDGELGLEIPFEILVQLGRISYSLELPYGTILKGHSTMLIPSFGFGPEGSNTIQWHLISSKRPGDYISPDEIPQSLIPTILDLDLHDLSSRRCFLGYCREAFLHVGAWDSGYQKTTLSQAERNHTTLRIGREINPTIGTGGMSILGGGIGAKVIFGKALFAPIEREDACLEDRLLNSADNATIIYNVENKTGFMVPELNAVLQIAHSWASRQPDRAELLMKIPFIRPSLQGRENALRTVMSNKKLLLREAYADEKGVFFMSKLKDIFSAIEKRKEQQRAVNDSSTRMIERRFICGWELYDIATCKPSYEKRIKLELSSAESWYKIPRQNPDMIVLLCSGVSDLIRPNPNDICEAWCPLPRDNYLMATAECIKSLSKKHGGADGKPRLGPKLYLQITRNNSILGNCEQMKDGGYNHVQSLRTSPPDHEVFLKNGAIIFGKSVSRKYKV